MAELGHVLDLWLCGALAPAVLVCTRADRAERLWRGLETRLGGRAALIRGVDPLEVKMNRSLYDRRDERSLRDELLETAALLVPQPHLPSLVSWGPMGGCIEAR